MYLSSLKNLSSFYGYIFILVNIYTFLDIQIYKTSKEVNSFAAEHIHNRIQNIQDVIYEKHRSISCTWQGSLTSQ